MKVKIITNSLINTKKIETLMLLNDKIDDVKSYNSLNKLILEDDNDLKSDSDIIIIYKKSSDEDYTRDYMGEINNYFPNNQKILMRPKEEGARSAYLVIGSFIVLFGYEKTSLLLGVLEDFEC